MAKLTLVVVVLAIIALSFAAQKKHDRNDYTTRPRKIVCYWGSWAYYHDQEHNYKDAYRLEAGDLDEAAEKCTHISYAFAKLDEYNYTMVPFDPDLELMWVPWGHDYYKKFIALRDKNPHLTLMIALGGWFEGSEKYSDMAKDPAKRKSFVSQAVQFLKLYGFDGMDLDWEYPANRLGKPEDKEDFILLLTELRDAFADEGYLLTAALSPGKGTIDKAYDRASIAKLNDLLDWANVMTYDYHGGFDDPPYLGHNAPLYRRPKEVDDIHTWFTINYTIHYYFELGMKKEKMVMGLPFYGRGFSIKDRNKHNLDDLGTGMSPAGRLSGQDGVLGYNELCELEAKGGWEEGFDPYYQAPFAYNDIEWIGFDNQESLICKTTFLKEMDLAGGMVWSIEFDDFHGDKCGKGKNPLLNTVHRYLLGDKKDAKECPYDLDHVPKTPTPTEEPTSPTTPSTQPTNPPTSPPTPSPTTPPTPSPTTPPTTHPTSPPTQPSTAKPTTHPVTWTTEEPGIIIDDDEIKCIRQGKYAYPYDRHKFILCEYVTEGPKKGWWTYIESCPLGTRWMQALQTCVIDDDDGDDYIFA